MDRTLLDQVGAPRVAHDQPVTVTPTELAAAWWIQEGPRATWDELSPSVAAGYVDAAADWLAVALHRRGDAR